HANEEAVAFLERHRRLRLAAEIAEARGLPIGLVVRQWFLAGERDRAVLLARRFGAFADAVARLERGGERTALRLLWAESRARAGSFAAAVDVAWPIAEARALAALWIDRAIEQGGASGARMLARKLELFPETFGEVLDRALLLAEDDEDPDALHAFAEGLAAA